MKIAQRTVVPRALSTHGVGGMKSVAPRGRPGDTGQLGDVPKTQEAG